MTRLRCCVVGVGHLGKEHARILSTLPEVDLVGVVDVQASQAEAVAARCQSRAFTDYRLLLDQVDAAVVVVPTTYHHAVACEFLSRGIPVLVEKPLAPTLAQAEALVELAHQHRTILQVGHIERFNPAYEELSKRPLRPRFIRCERAGTYSGRSTDIGAVLDLMIHDIDLVLDLVKSPVVSVQAMGLSVLGGHEDVAQAWITFEGDCVAELEVSRVRATPTRLLHAWGEEGFATLDFAKRRLMLTQPSEELRRLRAPGLAPDAATAARIKGELHERLLQTLDKECSAPADQLTRELLDFLHCIQTGSRPRVSGEDGRDALALAERILGELSTQSHRQHAAHEPTLPVPRRFLFTPTEGGAAA